MQGTSFILKNPELKESQQYSHLREVGIRYIEKLAHEIWTDYNVHDPGITLLEFLSYAVTDLGYRTSYEMKDLLTEEIEGIAQNNSTFHTARNIFSVNPTSFNDLRKWLIDIEGIRNAWISINQDVQYYLDTQNGRLVDSRSRRNIPIDPLNGLYDVLLEYEDYVSNDPRVAHLGIIEEVIPSEMPIPPENPDNYVEVSNQGILFKVRHPAKLCKVSVYADDSNILVGERRQVTIRLLRQTGPASFTEIASQEQRIRVAEMGTKFKVDLNFDLEPGNTYLLDAAGSSLELYKRGDGGFPYHLWQVVELISGYDGDNVPDYFFFYDWEINYAVSPVQIVANQLADPIPAIAGRLQNGFPSLASGFMNVNNEKLVFDVFCPMTLHSIDVFPEATGTVIINLQNEAGESLYDPLSVEVTGTMRNTVPLNWDIAPGLNYQISANGSAVRLYRHTNGGYPFDGIPALEIKHGLTNLDTITSNVYYFFYNWQITYQACLPEVVSLTKEDIMLAAQDRVHQVRNLCEDFMHIDELEVEQIGLCAEIGVRADVVVEEILAEIFFRLEWHISPPVNFYTIEELKAKGRTTDQIFEGPLLDHGFIDDEEFRAMDRRCFLSTSDILQLIMAVPGVETVKDISLMSYVKIPPVSPLQPGEIRVEIKGETYKVSQEPWILELQELDVFAPDFRPDRSRVIFFKNDLPYLPNMNRVEELYQEKRAAQIRNKLKGHENDLPVPLGNYKELETYYPIQNELPTTYRVGQNRVPNSDTDLRKAQSRQLKSFLLFFEQMLANYLAQLANIKELFSWKRGTNQSYFTQAISDISDIESLYIDHPTLSHDLEAIIESPDTALSRKNRFLDHLMGRFSEDFTEYALLKYGTYEEKTPEWRKAAQQLILDKQCFLEDYPVQSANRGKAFDYRSPNQRSITGFQRRMYRLMGIREDKWVAIWNKLIDNRFQFRSNAGGALQYELVLLSPSADPTDPAAPVLFQSLIDLDCESHEQFLNLLDELVTRGEHAGNWNFTETNEVTGTAGWELCEAGDEGKTVQGFAPAMDGDRTFLIDEILPAFAAYTKQETECEIGWRNLANKRFQVRINTTTDLYELALLAPDADPDDPEAPVLFHSLPDLDCNSQAQYCALLDNLIPFGANCNNWTFTELNEEVGTAGWELQQTCGAEEDAPKIFGFAPAPDDDKAYLLNEIIPQFAAYANREGFHLIEHILLRKRTLEDPFMPVEIHSGESGCDCVEVEDPYSFRVSIILPSWPERFQQVRFRQFMEKKLREEAPAHVYLKICWISHCEMQDFENHYENWLDQHAVLPDYIYRNAGRKDRKICARGTTPLTSSSRLVPDDQNQMEAYQDALANIIEKLHSLTTVFPMARLHDCEEDTGGEPPITLNNTSLGSL